MKRLMEKWQKIFFPSENFAFYVFISPYNIDTWSTVGSRYTYIWVSQLKNEILPFSKELLLNRNLLIQNPIKRIKFYNFLTFFFQPEKASAIISYFFI